MIPLRSEISTRRWPLSVGVLTLALLGVFHLELAAGAGVTALVDQFGLIPQRVLEGGYWPNYGPFYPYQTILSSIFLHANLAHLAGNLLPLWVFGRVMEDRLGHLRFLTFYLACGLAASVGHVLCLPVSTVPCVGASGAIAGVLGGVLIKAPRMRVLTLVPFFFIFRLIRFPAFLFLLAWFGLQIALIYSAGQQPIAVEAHVVGFLFGLLLSIAMPDLPARARKRVWKTN